MSEHTPTPWRLGKRTVLQIAAGEDDTVASVGCQSSLRDQWEANAAFIVKAVNAHDALVKALNGLLAATCIPRGVPSGPIRDAIKEAQRILDVVGKSGSTT